MNDQPGSTKELIFTKRTFIMKKSSTLQILLCLCVLFVNPLVSAAEPSNTQEVSQQVVNINTASSEKLAEMLLGVGASKAAAIVTYRETFGPFSSAEEITMVKGIGDKTLAENRDRIAVE